MGNCKIAQIPYVYAWKTQKLLTSHKASTAISTNGSDWKQNKTERSAWVFISFSVNIISESGTASNFHAFFQYM